MAGRPDENFPKDINLKKLGLHRLREFLKSPKWQSIQKMRASTGGACHPPDKSQDAASGRKLLQKNEWVSTELQRVMKELRALREAKEQLGAKVEQLERSLMAVPPALEPPAQPSEEVQMKIEHKELRRQLAQMQDSVLRLVRSQCSPGSSPPGPLRQSSTVPFSLQHNGALQASIVKLPVRQNPTGASAGDGMILHSALPHGQPDWQLGPGCLGGIDSHSPQAEENHQLASALQSEQLERKALARKLGQLQEKLCEITALMAPKSQEAQHLQQQGDQLLSQVWQHAESWQQLATEKEALCRRILLHRNLAMQLQDTEQEKMVALDRIRQGMQEDLKASRLQEEQAAPLRVLTLAGAGVPEHTAPGEDAGLHGARAGPVPSAGITHRGQASAGGRPLH